MSDPNSATCSTCYQVVAVAPRCSVCGALLTPAAAPPMRPPMPAQPPAPQPRGAAPIATPLDPQVFGGVPVAFLPPEQQHPPASPPAQWTNPTPSLRSLSHPTNVAFIEALRHGCVDARDLKGRTSRQAFWYLALALVALVPLLTPLLSLPPDDGLGGRLIVAFVPLLPLFTAAVRRMHDVGQPGYWVALALLLSPFILPLLVLAVFLAKPGMPGDNQYGPPYRGPSKPGWW